eukprot:Rmarinus@m.19458
MTQFSTMRFEAKIFLAKCFVLKGNWRNLPKSFAWGLQYTMAYALADPDKKAFKCMVFETVLRRGKDHALLETIDALNQKKYPITISHSRKQMLFEVWLPTFVHCPPYA